MQYNINDRDIEQNYGTQEKHHFEFMLYFVFAFKKFMVNTCKLQ